MELRVEGEGCHPGYHLDEQTQKCVCTSDRNVVRCDKYQRYFYARVCESPPSLPPSLPSSLPLSLPPSPLLPSL